MDTQQYKLEALRQLQDRNDYIPLTHSLDQETAKLVNSILNDLYYKNSL